MLSIWPIHHNYAVKELVFPVSLGTSLFGDINSDGVVNVLDVVFLINLVLIQEYNESAYLNLDQSLDVLGVVLLVNIIIN